MSIVEMLVAISIIAVAILGLLGELVADIRQQRTEHAQTAAIHLANAQLETARRLDWTGLQAILGTSSQPVTVPKVGVTFTQQTKLTVCAATDGPNGCTTPGAGIASIVRAIVTETWSLGGSSHHVTMSRNLSEIDPKTVINGVSSLVGGTSTGTGGTVVVASLALSPATATVGSTGHPSSAITATLTQTGLSGVSTVPLTWSDDNGAHQVTMTGSSGTYTVSIPASSITKTAGSSGGSVTFAATVPGTRSVPTATLAVNNLPSFGTCTVSPDPVLLLAVLGTRTSKTAVTLSCTTTNLAKTDSVVATYLSGNTSTTKTLTSSDGTSWSATLPSGTTMASTGLSQNFTFSLTRASDGASATTTKSVGLL